MREITRKEMQQVSGGFMEGWSVPITVPGPSDSLQQEIIRHQLRQQAQQAMIMMTYRLTNPGGGFMFHL